ncbi:MAG: gamma-glutamyl-gamma-aminobutyrate hydrolase family protein [Actinomycetota bacterium]
MSAEIRPLIGLPGRRKTGDQVDGFPDSLRGLEIDVYLADYARSVLAAGGLPVHLPMDADPAWYVPHLDGIVLSGGADLAPELYGAEPDGHGHYEPERDRLELDLLDAALDGDLPVLGICRGLQLLNVHHGGTLHQHVPEHARYDVGPETRVHEVSFDPASRLGLLYTGGPGRADGPDGPHRVNSLHHQIVDRVGHGLRVAARDGAGVVEGLEVPGRDVLAVQWHPEMLDEPEPVFGWLIARARAIRPVDGSTRSEGTHTTGGS